MTDTTTDDVPFDALRAMKKDMDRGKVPLDQQVISQIQACIEARIVQGKRITGVLAHIGFNKQYVGMQLKQHRGTDTSRHWWFRDDAELYHILVPYDG